MKKIKNTIIVMLGITMLGGCGKTVVEEPTKALLKEDVQEYVTEIEGGRRRGYVFENK